MGGVLPDTDPRARASPWTALRRLLLPAICLGCGEVGGERLLLGLCLRCRGAIPEPPAVACPGCGRPLVGALVPEGFRCGACAGRPPLCERVLVLGAYRAPLSAVVAALKFRRLEYLATHLAAALAARHGEALAGCDVLVPMPLHWRRRLQRGFDQARAIATPLAAAVGLPLRPVLVRRRATAPQSGLDRAARRRNVRGVFALRAGFEVAGLHVALLDDVVTTGATVEAAARVLRRAGAREITVVAVARTPRGEERLADVPRSAPGVR